MESSTKKKSKKKKDKKRKKKKKTAKSKNVEHSSKSISSVSDSENDNIHRKTDVNIANADYSGADSDASMMDLNENLKPIGDYIKNREQMFKEMLRSIRGSKLQAMLPEVLKNQSFDLVKAKCLEELEIMSKKRIRYVLMGKEMTSSSGTDESSSEEEDELSGSPNLPHTDSNIEEKDRKTIELSDDKLKINAENLDKTKKKQQIVQFTKFKPIGQLTNEITDEKQHSVQSKISDQSLSRLTFRDEDQHQIDYEHENSQGSLIENDAIIETQKEQHQQQQQSGIAAAGFKKFVKKSISIRLKTSDQSIKKPETASTNQKIQQSDLYYPDDYDNYNYDDQLHLDKYYNSKNTATSGLIGTSLSAHARLNQQHNRYEYANYMRNNFDDVDLRNEISSLLELDSAQQFQRETINQKTKLPKKGTLGDLMRNTHSDLKIGADIYGKHGNEYDDELNLDNLAEAAATTTGVFDYSYDLDEDLSNLNSEIERNMHADSSSEMDSLSSYCSSCNESEIATKFKHKKHKRSKIELSDDDDNDDDDDDELLSDKNEFLNKKEKQKRKHSKIKAKKKNKKLLKIELNDEKHLNQNDVESVKKMLRNLIEGYIENMDESNEDYELKEILENLLKQILDNDALTLEECEDIRKTVTRLYEQANKEQNDENTDIDIKEKKRKKRKRKTKTPSDDSDLALYTSTSKRKKSTVKNKRKTSSKKPHSDFDDDDDDVDDNDEYEDDNNHDDGNIVEQGANNNNNNNNRLKNKDLSNNYARLDSYLNTSGHHNDNEEIEAGEIDDIYDDELIIEKELESLLKQDHNDTKRKYNTDSNTNQYYNQMYQYS